MGQNTSRSIYQIVVAALETGDPYKYMSEVPDLDGFTIMFLGAEATRDRWGGEVCEGVETCKTEAERRAWIIETIATDAQFCFEDGGYDDEEGDHIDFYVQDFGTLMSAAEERCAEMA